MKFDRLPLTASAALAALALTACGPIDTRDPATHTVTSSVTMTTATSTTAATQPSPTTSARTPKPAAPPITELQTDIGGKITVNGEPAVVCVFGDGFGINTVAAGANTSCEFATATLNAATSSLNATYDNVRDILPATVTAHSPVTGQDYRMQCAVDQDKVITCRGGDNAAVFMY